MRLYKEKSPLFNMPFLHNHKENIFFQNLYVNFLKVFSLHCKKNYVVHLLSTLKGLCCESIILHITDSKYVLYSDRIERICLSHCATIRNVAVWILEGIMVIFHSHNNSSRPMALMSTQPLTEINTRNISLRCVTLRT